MRRTLPLGNSKKKTKTKQKKKEEEEEEERSKFKPCQQDEHVWVGRP
jgi:hypothetical protein